MSIGYACLTLGVPFTDMKKCLIKNADEVRLNQLIAANLCALERMVDYNLRNGIKLFRISSDIIPFASSPVNSIRWSEDYAFQLAEIGRKIRTGGMRVSMHPGQYTVLNSPNAQTVENAIRELDYHALFLDSLGLDASHKIILHLGGAYGDKSLAIKRFTERYQALDDRVKARLVIENDDKIYNIQEVLETGLDNRIPVVFDNLHHQANHGGDGGGEQNWIAECAKTWGRDDGRQKIHYSQSNPRKKVGAHSLSIDIDAFLHFYENLALPKPDIMLEVKDKNISAIKCVLCTAEKGEMGALEREWGRYKYLVLEHSQAIYNQIRILLKDKSAYPAVAFYRLVEEAMRIHIPVGGAVNAATHVWGYFKDCASQRQKADFLKYIDGYAKGIVPLFSLKHKLLSLALEHKQTYLLESYYFVKLYSDALTTVDRD